MDEVIKEERPASRRQKIIIGILVVIAAIEGVIIYQNFSGRGLPTIGTKKLGLPAYTFLSNDDYIHVIGSWIADSSNSIYFNEFPFQTSEINCYKSRDICIEARAIRNENTGEILTVVLEYEVKEWNASETKASLNGPAGSIELNFDVIKKVVTLMNTERANIEGARKLPAYAHLDSGEKALERSNEK